MNFVWHLGLGDQIINAGAAVYHSLKTPVTVPCFQKYLGSVRSFFICHPNITVYGIDSESEMVARGGLRSGYHNGQPRAGESLDEWFYRDMGLPFSVRWDYSPLQLAATHCPQIKVPAEPYIFVHEDHRRITKLERNRCIVTPPTAFNSILECATLVENAQEVHVIPSCFKPFTDSLTPKGKLFLHWYARPTINHDLDMLKSRYNWVILE